MSFRANANIERTFARGIRLVAMLSAGCQVVIHGFFKCTTQFSDGSAVIADRIANKK